MKRRAFITLLGGAAALPLAARAQQQPGGMRRIGVLVNAPESDPSYRSHAAAFAQTLQRLGWREGKNLHLDLRSSAGDPERIAAYAAELAGMTPDLILASSSAYLTALLRTTGTIISARSSASIFGRPPRARDFHRQYRRKPARCQRTRVSGRMIVMALRTDGNQRYSMTKNKRPPFVSWTRPLTLLCSTIS